MFSLWLWNGYILICSAASHTHFWLVIDSVHIIYVFYEFDTGRINKNFFVPLPSFHNSIHHDS